MDYSNLPKPNMNDIGSSTNRNKLISQKYGSKQTFVSPVSHPYGKDSVSSAWFERRKNQKKNNY